MDRGPFDPVLATEEKVARIKSNPIAEGQVVYAWLDGSYAAQIVRILKRSGDDLTVERAEPRHDDGWPRGPVNIKVKDIAR